MILELTQKPGPDRPAKLNKYLDRLNRLVDALKKNEPDRSHEDVLNTAIHNLNHFHGNDHEMIDQARLTYKRMYDYVLKEMGLVPRGYYQALWIGLGMAIFGVPLGMAMGAALGNFAFIGIGPGMGLPIGIAIGTEKDKKAAREGRQLDFKE